MYIILHTGYLYFDTHKKRSSAGRFFCPALHSIIYYSLYFLLPPMQLLFFLLVLFQDFLHDLLCHKPILHFRFGLAVLKFVSPDFGQKKIEPRPILVFKE